MPTSTETRQRWVLLALTVFTFFFLLGSRALNEPDEGRYSEVAREMIETGNWLVPHFWYLPHLDKPPMTYWLVATRACGHQRCVGGVAAGLFHRRSPRRLVERADSAKFTALLRHGANVDAGHFPDAIHRMGYVFFLAKLARFKFRIPNSEFRIFSVAFGWLGCHCVRFFDQGTGCRGHSARCAGGAGRLSPEKFFSKETSILRSGWRTGAVFGFGDAVVFGGFSASAGRISLHGF